MPLVSTAAVIGRVRGVAAFNVITLEHAEAIVSGAEAAGVPVILQISENAVRFHGGGVRPIAGAAAAVAEGAAVDVALHLDHVTRDDLLHQAAECGFGSVMYDASAQPYDRNVAATKAAADRAHGAGLWIEAELGEVGGKGGAHEPGARTDPGEAAAFVAATGVDALAVAVGSSHAMTTRTAVLDHGLIAELRDALPVPLVLHGSSGVPDVDLRRAVEAGMRKINIGTALNIAFTSAVRSYLGADREVVDPRKYIAEARTAMAETVRHLASAVSGR